MSKNKQIQLEIGEGMVFFLLRQKFWQSLEDYCRDAYKRTNDPFYVFWKAFACFKLGNSNDSINQLISIQQKKEISYAVYVALIYYHNQARNIDKEQLDLLKSKEREERRNGADKAFIQAAYFYLNIGEWRRASDLINEKNSKTVVYSLARLWLDILNPENQNIQGQQAKVQSLFNEKDKVIPKIQIFVIRAYVASALKKYDVALETINEGIIFYPDFVPFINEKCNCLMSLTQWQQFNQAAQQIIAKDPSNILASKCIAFNELAREGNIDNAFMKLKQLQGIIERKQGKNSNLLYEIAHLFSRISGRNVKIVNLLQKFIGKCRKLEPMNADYAIELANQNLMIGQLDKAYQTFQQASSLDESKVQTIAGMIECKILQGEMDDAEKQIQFVNVMQMSVGRTPQIAYLEALLQIKKSQNQGRQSLINALKFVDNALKMQITYSKTLTSGFSFYSKLNPNFLFSLAELYLNHVSMKEMLEGGQNSNPAQPVGKGIKLLQSITRQIPGFLPAYLLTAKGKLAVGNELDAATSITKVLELDPKNEQGYILQAMIKNKKKQYEGALNSLNEAISHNFKIRENPLFMLIKGEIEYEMKDYVTAELTMEQTVNLPSIKRKQPFPDAKKYKVLSFSEKDRCSIYLLLAKCYMKNKKLKQTKTIMTQAIGQFTGTSQQVNVLLTNALISVETGDIKKAISILKAVKNQSSYFVESRKMLADIQLNYLKSRKGYARCFFQVIQANPSFENYKLYGDALIKINQPEDAALAYAKAFELKNDNEGIIRDLGRAYAMSHDYDKAIDFYEHNISKVDRVDLSLDLAKLYIQLKRFDKAEQLLNIQKFSDQSGNFQKLKQNVEGFYTLYKLFLKRQGSLDFSPNDNARKSIKNCIKFQLLSLDKCKIESGNVSEEKKILADYYYEVASYTYNYEKSTDASIKMLNECLKCWQEHQKALQLIATIYLKEGEPEKCQYYCQMLLKLNPKNDQASFILAQIMLKSNQYEKAIQQFKRILTQKPGNYPVLAKLIDFFRRNNELEKAKLYLDAAQAKASNTNDAGLCFCRALYNKFTRNPRQALTEFNKAKKSIQYAQQSLVHMIDIYLNPDQDMYYSCIEQKARMVDPENIRVCQNLLREMQTRASFHRFVVSEAYVIMMGNKPFNVEQVIKKLVQILKNRTDYAPAMFAIAIAKFLAKKQSEAKNFLKILSKKAYDSQVGQELEKAWLMHAECFVKIEKFDNAEQILRQILKENKSCGKAEQYMGLIKQKEQAYVDAANHYDKAYKLTLYKSASIGYRLAFNYLKAKRYIDCIQICRNILEMYPSYPNIQKQVMQKAIQALK